MYSIETLLPLNGAYAQEHRITQSDADEANRYVELIQSSRSDCAVCAGDIIELTRQHGSYYEFAHIEHYDAAKDNWYVCEQPSIPFVYEKAGGVYFTTSGGAWCHVPKTLKLIGKKMKYFKVWGHCGSCANGVEFKGHWPNQTVVFLYKEHDHLISKEEWDKLDLPRDTRQCNGINLCKVRYDEENHCIHVYRFGNSGTLDYRRYKPYELARGRNFSKEAI
jgi:hypothetical protein